MKNINELISDINTNADSIKQILTTKRKVKNLNDRLNPLEKYNKIQNLFSCNNLSTFDKEVFKKYYIDFYQLQTRFLNITYINNYFNLFDYYRQISISTDHIKPIAEQLRDESDKEKYQFSFLTKFMHTCNPTIPIYDNNVKKTLALSKVNGKTYPDKVTHSIDILNTLQNCYKDLENNSDFCNTLKQFDILFQDFNIQFVKKCDFIFWALKKIKR